MSLDEPEPVDSILTFLSEYDTLEYTWVKATAVSVRLRILFVTLQNTNSLEHLPPQFDVVEAFIEVVDDVPVISFRNGITVSKVPLDVVAEGLIRLLHDTCQIPSGFGTRTGRLVVLDEGTAEILPIVDGASRERFEPVEGVAPHHDREVGSHEVVVAARSSYGDGVGA